MLGSWRSERQQPRREAPNECCFTLAMQDRIAVGHDRAGCKHKSSSAVAVDQTAADGALRQSDLDQWVSSPGPMLGIGEVLAVV